METGATNQQNMMNRVREKDIEKKSEKKMVEKNGTRTTQHVTESL